MPLGSSSAAPVMSPGPSTCQSRGLLGPTTDGAGVADTWLTVMGAAPGAENRGYGIFTRAFARTNATFIRWRLASRCKFAHFTVGQPYARFA
jgi:hypothetical protein